MLKEIVLLTYAMRLTDQIKRVVLEVRRWLAGGPHTFLPIFYSFGKAAFLRLPPKGFPKQSTALISMP